MQYILDTADLTEIRHAIEFYPIEGVTTNPSIIAKEKGDFKAIIMGIRDIIGPEKSIHVQVTAESADEIVAEAKLLKKLLGKNFYAKIPISEAGIKATMLLKELGIPVTMTAIHTPQQAFIAAKAGAAYVAPYVNRLDNIDSDGIRVVEEIVNCLDHFGIDCKVLAASFKNTQQVHGAVRVGCHAVTVAPEVLYNLINHPLTDIAVENFNKDWEGVYGKKKIPALL